MTPLANLFRDKRKARGLTIQQAADLIGTSKSYVCEVEAGLSEPSVSKAAAWATALKISAKALFNAARGGETTGANA